MKSRLSILLAIGCAGLTCAFAGEPPRLPAHFSGVLNDYTPTKADGIAIKGSPYEMHGTWRLELDESQRLASFSAAVTMQTPDFLNSDPDFDPAKLGAHVHHIAVSNGMVHVEATDVASMCPKLSPPTTGGFAITGMAYVAGNGSNAPFGNPSPVTICILGGTNPGVSGAAYVVFSNLTLTFGSPASSHFGAEPIHGVIVRCSSPRWESHPCRVAVDH